MLAFFVSVLADLDPFHLFKHHKVLLCCTLVKISLNSHVLSLLLAESSMSLPSSVDKALDHSLVLKIETGNFVDEEMHVPIDAH